ncbi:hypothetical protein B5X24_HaOG213987 [Helicoverpa armigera]|nr:hypothetical protein B5X24_HaOG213987 [Helicoverpa armigera]
MTAPFTLPESIRLIRAVSSFKSDSPASPALEHVRSLRCCGVKPSRPPAEPLRKEPTAAHNWLAVIVRLSESGAGGSGKERSSDAAGCLLSRAATVSGEHGATTSLLKRILAAPLMSPSPNFEKNVLVSSGGI